MFNVDNFSNQKHTFVGSRGVPGGATAGSIRAAGGAPVPVSTGRGAPSGPVGVMAFLARDFLAVGL